MDSSENEKRAGRFLILALSSSAAGIGLLALVGWVFELPLLASFGSDLIPMAPSTALLFVLYGAALFLRIRFPQKRGTYLIGMAIGSFGGATALLLFFLSSAAIHPQIEHLGLSPLGTVGSVPIGHMSPLTEICFVVIALSLLAALSSSAERLWRAWVAFSLACLSIIISLVLLLAYLLGTPLLYGGDVIPPALSTSLAFLVLALGLLVTAGLQVRAHDRLQEAATARESYILVLVFVLLASGIVNAGYFYYRNYEKNIERKSNTSFRPSQT